jgi:hypothetical protein
MAHADGPALPAQFRTGSDVDDEFVVSELASENAGAHSPFGDIKLPMPVGSFFYTHPGPDDRPNLAGA